jgi:lantibiotic modifying enzyme
MTLSKAEIDGIVRGATDRAASGAEIRRLLYALSDFEFHTKRATPLVKLCAAGADYGWRELERTAKPELLTDLSTKAKGNLRRDLRRNLEEITRPSLNLEWSSFGLAVASLGFATGQRDAKQNEEAFLRDKPSHRLFSLFKKFPVLAGLWCQLICQWRQHVMEVFVRLAADHRALSQTFFAKPIHKIANAHFGLSDRHNSGRTVVRLQFDAGSIIYKPRSGAGEAEWFSLLDWMNGNGFQPKLRAARVLQRQGYCWMEYIEPASCRTKAAARRFYQRLGGMIAAAHLLKAVDCHRDNLIASGEDPVLVDVDTLWHVSSVTKTQILSHVLYRTGFFPNSNRRSLLSRSSVLGWTTIGNHLARIGGKPLEAARYQREIISGFTRAWHCVLGTRGRRAAFLRRLRRIRSGERRWIYWATAKYAAIRRASIQPAALRSRTERDLVLTRLCTRDTVAAALIDAELRALKQLDIPYFIRRTNESMPPDKGALPPDLIEAIRQSLEWS